MAEVENPLGTEGFEFVEFTSPDPAAVEAFFEKMGFVAVSRHPTRDVVSWVQNDITYLLNRETSGHAAQFRADHGPSASAMAFRVKDAAFAHRGALERGATDATGRGALEGVPAIEGIGGSLLYLVDRHGERGSLYEGWTPIEGAEAKLAADGTGQLYLDHLTHNVRRGNMATWADFYERVFNFREIRYFDIQGKATGLFSKAMTSPDGNIRIPLNESKGQEGKLDQIEEFIQEYRGEGIQHIALGCRDLYETVDALNARGVPLQDTIDTYYDLIDKRLPGHGEPVDELRKRRMLVDGDPENGGGLLLQIFSKNAIGPIFFEFIQRKGNEGFGEGNFKALFESIELDQIRRGVIKVDA
ncbi:MAG TPA: 4-hydroxyphenylpyruvate dioxygenase [Caulobacteraceae bacterium]|nr:4-hydroxyphenylpyruvate dioxygenase [Caulobacteraceae bacterium]